jgi:hypothetical protein
MNWFKTTRDREGKRIYFFKEVEYLPSLREAIKQGGLDPAHIKVAFRINANRLAPITERHHILIEDGKCASEWHAPKLSELFRGDRGAGSG